MGKTYEKYEHHGVHVWSRVDLKGTHREHCLCFDCKSLNIDDPEDNCEVADELYQFCVKWGMTTPVFTCPFFRKKDK